MSSQTHPKPKLLLLDCSLRASLIPVAIASLCLTLTSHQNNPDYGGSISFTNLMALKYMAFTAALAAAYSLLALICSWVRLLPNKSWLLFLSDQVMAYLLLTSGSAATELQYLAYKGDIDVTWSEACSFFGSFCNKLKIALILHFLALLFFIVLVVISGYRAFSVFYPPATIGEEKGDTTVNCVKF